MVSREMKQKDIIEELKERTGFYKMHIKTLLDALDDIIVENMNTAAYDEPSAIFLFPGLKIGAKRVKERPWREPRGGTTIAPEKLLPYCKFQESFRTRMNELKPDELENEEIDDDE